MGIRIGTLVGGAAQLQWQGLTVNYLPSKWTPESELRQNEPGFGIPGFMALVIESWDLEDDEGNPIPTDFDGMKKVPAQVLLGIQRTILNEMAEAGAEGKSSAATLQLTGQSVSGQSGTGSSEQPGTSTSPPGS